jgi:hypothetical protein
MRAYGHNLETMLGAIALMAVAICLLTLWVLQCGGAAARRRVLAARDGHARLPGRARMPGLLQPPAPHEP